MSSKVRVYEVARDLGMDNKALVALFQSVGITEVRNHMSAVAPEAVERVKRHLEKQQSQKVVEERIRPTVVKRRAVKKKTEPAEAKPASEKQAPPPAAKPAVVRRAPAAKPAEQPAAAAPPAAKPAAPPVAAEEKAQAAAPPTPAKPEAEAKPAAPAKPAAEAPKPAEAKPVAAEQKAPVKQPEAKPAEAEKPAEKPAAAAAPPAEQKPPAPQPRPSSPPKTGVEVWEGRPGVPMPQQPRGGPTPRRVQYDAKAGGGMAGRHRGPMRMGRGMRHRGIGSLSRPKGSGQPVTQERSAHKKVVRMEGSIGLQTLASNIQLKAVEVLRKLMSLGMTGVHLNSTLDADTAKLVANEFGWEVEDLAVSEEDAIVAAQGLDDAAEEEKKTPRPPVVTVMGHVDHGKTSLLDKIRKANVVAGEAGGITQHIGAYGVDTKRGKLTFLDTPGHEAFTAMRARGAQTTDVVILVVAADDGVMPQTKEAINHAQSAKVPIVVAINKCDKPDAQPERVRRELSENGLVPEEWGGETLFEEVSAVSGDGIDALLEKVVLQSEMLDLRANPDKPAVGVVVEAELDRGRGPVATVLVTEGTLHRGDALIAGAAHGKVRAMLDHNGKKTNAAGPATPVAVIGLNEVPSAGDPVHVVTDLKKAQEIAESRKDKERKSTMASTNKVSLEDLARAMSQAEQLELKVIIKADVQGSAEAVSDALDRLSTEKVKVSVVHTAVGGITENDVNLAVAAGAIIIGFNVRPAGKASGLAQKEGVEIRQYTVIYNVVDDVKAAMEGLLAPKLVEKVIGKAEVRQTFRISKAGTVAGCMVVDGVVRRGASVRLLRDDKIVWEGKMTSLKRFKEDAREVKEGFDCGISLEAYNDVKQGDVIEVYEIEEVKQTL